MPFRIYCHSRRTARELRKLYRLRFSELALIDAGYCRHKDGLSGLALAKQLADKKKLIIIYGLVLDRLLDEDKETAAQLQKMPNVRFLDSPLGKEEVHQAYNDLRAPWLPHMSLPNPKAKRAKTKTRD